MPSRARAATPLALVVLAFAALAYAYLVDRGTVSDADREERARDVFPTFRLDLVRRIELSHGQETLVLERAKDPGANWALTSPRREAADPSAVDSLLRDLELARRMRTVSKETVIGEIRVRGRITVDRVQYTFTLGADAPYPRGGAYMTLLGEPPFVVEPSLKVQLLRTADAYRNRSLVRYAQSEVKRVERTCGAEHTTLERIGETFRVGGSSGLRASRAAVDRLFAALADARVETFLDDAEADRATAHPLLTLVVSPRDGMQPPVNLAVGGPCPSQPGQIVVSRMGPTQTSACVARGALDALDATADDLVDKAPLFARADEIEEIDLRSSSSDGPRVNLARRGTGWHERAPEDRELNAEEADSANTLVIAMAGAQALSARSTVLGERVTARSHATFVRTGTGSSETLDISAADPSGVAFVQRSDDGAILRMPRAIARRFEPHPIALRGRSAWATPFDPVDVVAIDDTCTPEPERLDLTDGRWTMRLPHGQAVDVAYALDLVESLVHAKVDEWIAETDDGTFGLSASACGVTLSLTTRDADGATLSHSMTFGTQPDGTNYARTREDPAVFSPPQSLRTLLEHPAIDRSPFRIDASPGTRVTLSHDHATVALRAEGGAFVRTGVSEAGADSLGVALVAFYARNAAHAGPPALGEGFDHPVLEIQVENPDKIPVSRRILVGRPAGGPDESMFARVSGVNATFVVAGRTVEALRAGW
jgi:hypothetical protein